MGYSVACFLYSVLNRVVSVLSGLLASKHGVGIPFDARSVRAGGAFSPSAGG